MPRRAGKNNESIQQTFMAYYTKYLKGMCSPEIEISVVDCETINALRADHAKMKAALEKIKLTAYMRKQRACHVVSDIALRDLEYTDPTAGTIEIGGAQ